MCDNKSVSKNQHKTLEILKIENITKIYPNGFIANRNINFSVDFGEIHALVGENGAGKSTLMKILFGIERQQEGCIFLKAKSIQPTSPQEAIKYGICMVQQHFMLFPSLSVAENMVLGIEPLKNGFLDMKKSIKITEEISKKYNLYVNPREKVENLSMGNKQKIEILKTLLRGAEILILDEPTAVLTPQETNELFIELKNLKKQGVTIIFISHKLREIKQIADRITVLRNGCSEKTILGGSVTEQEISRLMVGRDVSLEIQKEKNQVGGRCLEIKELSYKNINGKQVLKDINITVRAGEIVGIAGVEGNGQDVLINLITGIQKAKNANIKVSDLLIDNLSIREIRELGMAHIPEDRIAYGVAENTSIENNLISNQFYKKKYNNFLFLDFKKIKAKAENMLLEYRVKCKSIKQNVKSLSGGNIQKIVLAREFSSRSKLLIANQPSRGVDVGSAEFIYQKLLKLRKTGTGVLLVSADLNEVMGLSDRLFVMYDGEIVAHFINPSIISESTIGQYMLGIKKQSKKEMAIWM